MIGRDIVYKRVSTQKQETDRQFFQQTFHKEFEDKLSGKNLDRPQLSACLSYLKKGDTLHVWEVSRLSRNLSELREVVFKLIARGISVRFHKEGLDFLADNESGMKTAMSKMQLNLMGSVAEFERAMISERVREGIQVAKTKGVKIGAAVHGNKKRTGMSYNTKSNIDSNIGETLKFMRNMGMTYAQMADRLNQEGKKTPRGSNFEGKGVYRMCKKFGVC